MKCGFYQKEITPPLDSYIPGNGPKYAAGVKDPLYVRAVVLEDEAGHKTALAALDSLMLEMEHTEAILARVKEYTDLTEENTVLTCIHAHTGTPFWQYEGQDAAFMPLLFKMVADCITLAWQRLQPCEVTFGKELAEGIAFTRDYRMKDGTIRCNPGFQRAEEILGPTSPADPEFPVLFFRDSEGKPLGSISNFACHCDCVGGYELSADYPGEMSRCLKAEFGAEFVSLFLPGCSGDVNHVDYIGQKKSDYKEMGRILAEKVKTIAEGGESIGAAGLMVARRDLMIRRRTASRELIDRAKAVVLKPKIREEGEPKEGQYLGLLRYHKAYEGKPLEVLCPVQTIKLGDIFIFCLPGEVYHAYGQELKARCGGKALVCELANTRAGYIPTPDLIKDGPIWTSLGSVLGLACFLEGNAGRTMVENALEMAEEMK